MHYEYHDSTILPVSLLPSEAGLDLDMASASPQPPHGVRSPAPGPGDAGLLVAATWLSALSWFPGFPQSLQNVFSFVSIVWEM